MTEYSRGIITGLSLAVLVILVVGVVAKIFAPNPPTFAEAYDYYLEKACKKENCEEPKASCMLYCYKLELAKTHTN